MALAALCLLPAPALHAQTWTGTASHLWNDPANWNGGLPVSGPNTALSSTRAPVWAQQQPRGSFILRHSCLARPRRLFSYQGYRWRCGERTIAANSVNEQIVQNSS
jgi:hypothetical protein